MNVTESVLDEIMAAETKENPERAELENEDSPSLPTGFEIGFVNELPKRKPNLLGREGIRWEEVLEPFTKHVGRPGHIYLYHYHDDAEAKRKQSLCAGKATAIRKRLRGHVEDEDWEVVVRTDDKKHTVGIYVTYHGELTPARRKERDEREAARAKAATQAKATKDAGKSK